MNGTAVTMLPIAMHQFRALTKMVASYGKPVPDEALWWITVQYDPKTGKCPLHETKNMTN